MGEGQEICRTPMFSLPTSSASPLSPSLSLSVSLSPSLSDINTWTLRAGNRTGSEAPCDAEPSAAENPGVLIVSATLVSLLRMQQRWTAHQQAPGGDSVVGQVNVPAAHLLEPWPLDALCWREACKECPLPQEAPATRCSQSGAPPQTMSVRRIPGAPALLDRLYEAKVFRREPPLRMVGCPCHAPQHRGGGGRKPKGAVTAYLWFALSVLQQNQTPGEWDPSWKPQGAFGVSSCSAKEKRNQQHPLAPVGCLSRWEWIATTWDISPSGGGETTRGHGA